jgi:four helix bundle protein
MRDFRKLEIWKDGILIVKKVYEIAGKLPKDELYGLRSQITRAAVSIPSNVAEGCSRNSEIDFKRFLEIAIGSLFELETQLIIIDDLGMMGDIKIIQVMKLIHKEGKMINGLINRIKQTNG